MHREKGSGLEPWPKRLTAAPPRLEEVNVSPDEFYEDTVSSLNDKKTALICIIPDHVLSFSNSLNHLLLTQILVAKIYVCRTYGIIE